MKTKLFLIALFCVILAGCQKENYYPSEEELSKLLSYYLEHGDSTGTKILNSSAYMCLKPAPADTTVSAAGGVVAIRVSNISDYNLNITAEFYVPEDDPDQSQWITLIDSTVVSDKVKEYRFEVKENDGKERNREVFYFADLKIPGTGCTCAFGIGKIRQLSK